MRLYVDLETLQLIEGPGFRNPVSSLRFKRGDAAQLEVVFLQDATTAVEIGDPASMELQFGIKPRGRYDVGYLVHTSDWTLPDQGAENPAYLCAPSFNTVELDSAMQVGSSTGTELSEISLMGEITWREGVGDPTSTRTFSVIVENDVNRGTEGVPEDADPAYPPPTAIEVIARKGVANGYAGLDGSGKVPLPQLDLVALKSELASIYPSPAHNMLRAVSTEYSGSVVISGYSSSGYFSVMWWDGTVEVVGTGDSADYIDLNHPVPSTGAWSKSTPKDIHIWSSTSTGIPSGSILKIYIAHNRLISLDVSRLPDLTVLDCPYNDLEVLDVSRNPLLTTLLCGNNKLGQLDTSRSPALTILRCGTNQLAILNLGILPDLVELDAYSNAELSSMSVVGFSSLHTLKVKNCQLTDLPGVGDTVIGANPSDYDPIFDVSGNDMDADTLDAILTNLPQPPYAAIADLSYNPGSNQVDTGLAKPNWIILT